MKKASWFIATVLILVLALAACVPRGGSETVPETGKADAVDPGRTYSYDQMIEDAHELARLYPGLIDVSSIGRSVEGRDLTLLRLGKGPGKVLLLGAHHAREYISSAFLMETADEYAAACVSGAKLYGYDIRRLLDDVTVYIVPMVNPDGVNLVQYGPDAAKDPAKVRSMRMLQQGFEAWKANINGVDLNRQYPCHWAEKQSATGVPSSEMYKGNAPATEPEVKAVIALCEAQRFTLAASFHTKGEVIYWADSGTNNAIPAGSGIAQALGEATGYRLMPVSEDPAVYGAGFENWFRQEFTQPAFCIELTPAGNGAKPHDDADFARLVWDKAGALLAALLHQADTAGHVA